MTVGFVQRMAGSPPVPAFVDPITSIPWLKVGWADDPAWTNPGDGAAVTSWRNGGSLAGDFATSKVGTITFRASVAALNSHAAIEFALGSQIRATTFTVQAVPFTIVWIGKRTTFASGGTDYLVDASNGAHIVLGANATNWFANNATNILSAAAPDTGTHALRGLFNGTGSALAVDAAITTGTLSTSSAAIFILNCLGGGAASNSGANQVGFVGLYKGDLRNHAQWPGLQAWALSYYGVTLG